MVAFKWVSERTKTILAYIPNPPSQAQMSSEKATPYMSLGGRGRAEMALPADRIVYQRQSKWDAQPRKPLFSESQGELNRAKDKRRGLERWCQRQILGLSHGRQGISRSMPVPCQPPRAPGLCARRGRLWGRLFSRHPAGEPQGCCQGSPPPQVPAPKHSWSQARGPWTLFLLLTCRTSHSSTASCSEALAQRIHRSPLRGRRVPLLRQNPPAPRTHTALTVRTRKPFLSLQIPSCKGGTVCATRQAWQRKPLLHRCPIYSPL